MNANVAIPTIIIVNAAGNAKSPDTAERSPPLYMSKRRA